MRFFEINNPKIQPAPQASVPPVNATKEPHPADDQPAAQPAGPVYADATQTKKMRTAIAGVLKTANLTGNLDTKATPLHPSLRILNAIPREAHYDAVTQAGYKLTPADAQSKTVTGNPTYQANTYNFIVDGVTYTLVLAAKGGNQAGGGGGAQIGTQQLRPNKLGLTGEGVTWSRTTLAAHLNKTLPSVIQDQITVNALNQLIDVALKKRKTIDPELMQHISGGALNEISQSFGEVLTPILMAGADNFIITFPTASNEMLIDAEVDGKPVAVKSLGGSGNSFAAIRDLIKQYSAAKKESNDLEYDEMLDLISEFVSDKGSTNDNVIRVSQKAMLPEAAALNTLLGTTPQSFAELLTATTTLYQTIVNEVGQAKAYERYIQMIMPVAKAGNWSKAPKEGAPKKDPKVQALGMPNDWRRYSGDAQKETDEEKPAKRTGKTAFDRNFPVYAAKQLTYLLGVAFDKEMNAGKRAADMGQTLNKIMSSKNAVSAKISITPQGGLELIEKPFSSVNWKFKYHAATDAPDRNAPGFAMKF